MVSWTKPTSQQVDRVLALIKKPAQYAYFFNNLKNPEWIAPLRERGFFRQPPEPARHDDVVEFPAWPESRYLARMASDAAELVLDTIKAMPDTENFRVHLDLLEAARNMPPDKAAEIAPLAKGWLANEYQGLLPGYAGEFMLMLAEGGQEEAAATLLEALTEPRLREITLTVGEGQTIARRQAEPRFAPWHLKRVLEDMLPALAAGFPLTVAQVLDRQLRKCLEMERRFGHGSDGSHVWRPAIESHPQNWGEEQLKTTLTVGLRDALELAAKDQPDIVGEIIERYVKDPLSIFRRLALHLIRVGGDGYNVLAAQSVRDPALRDDPPLHHEYYRLLQDRFTALPESVRNEYLGWVDKGRDPDDFNEWPEQLAGQQPSEEEIQMYKERWQLEQLKPIRDSLPDDWRARYDTLAAQHGEPEHPEFLVWSSTTWVGPTSPREKEELGEMGADQTILYLKTFEPSGEPLEDSRWGLGQVLQAAVEADPARYLAVANRFLEERLHPTYVYHLVTGLDEAWKKGAHLDWKQLLGFFAPVSMVMTGEGPPLADHKIGIDDTGWVGVRMAISRFLSGALARDDRDLEPEVLPRISEILLRLIRDPDPTRADEEARLGGAMDWVSIRINTARGVAASSLLEYALRYARIHKAEHEAARTETGYAHRMEPSVKTAFTDMLDKQKEPSAAVHSLFGEFLPNFVFLDRQWMVAHLESIFPPEPEELRYWEAAWQGYMLYCPRVYRELYELLRPQYLRALRTPTTEDRSYATRNAQERIAQHVAIAYAMGFEALEPHPETTAEGLADERAEGSLLSSFLARGSGELRASLARSLGAVLEPGKEVPREQWARLRQYWEGRTAAALAAPDDPQMDQELSAFVSWLAAIPEQLNTLASLLRPCIQRLATGHDAHELLEYLSDQSASHPGLATELLRVLLDREAVLARGPDLNRIYLIGAEQEIWTILENAMGADDAARASAISVINLLGERGDYAYRDLLRPSE